MSEQEPSRRPYNSPLRRQRAAETRERIISVGVELVHEQPFSDWRSLTARTVAERAGVNERTVYRHFASERALRDAVFQRLQDEAGIPTLEGMTLADVAGITERTFTYVASFPVTRQEPLDATLADVDQRRRDALLAAVDDVARDWSEADRTAAAAMLDVLWHLPSYERLVTVWELDPKRAVKAMTWVIGLVDAAIREGRGPGR